MASRSNGYTEFRPDRSERRFSSIMSASTYRRQEWENLDPQEKAQLAKNAQEKNRQKKTTFIKDYAERYDIA